MTEQIEFLTIGEIISEEKRSKKSSVGFLYLCQSEPGGRLDNTSAQWLYQLSDHNPPHPSPALSPSPSEMVKSSEFFFLDRFLRTKTFYMKNDERKPFSYSDKVTMLLGQIIFKRDSQLGEAHMRKALFGDNHVPITKPGSRFRPGNL